MDDAQLPSHCRYRRKVHVVLAYEGDGRFLVQRDGEKPMSVHRDHLHFFRPVVKAAAAVDEVVEQLRESSAVDA